MTCVYIPPKATKAETFEKLSSYIDQISTTPSTLHIVCGDLHVNFLKKSAKSTLMINQMEINALALVDPQTATRETIRTKTCMDVFFTNFKKSFVEKTKISDHYTVGLELIKREKSSESVQILRRNWNKLDDDHLVELNCFLQKKFESASGQLLTSDTNRCAEIVHERTKLSSYIDQISITPSTLHIVCGDLNVNFLKKSAKSTLNINQMEMNALALEDPQTATRETIRTKTCMDVFFYKF